MEIQKWRAPSLLWILLLICIIFVFAFNIMQIQVYSIKTTFLSGDRLLNLTKQNVIHGYFIKTEGCSIPEMKAMDPSIVKYIFNETIAPCNNGTPPLMDSNHTSIFLLESSLHYYRIDDIKLLECSYQEFYRISPEYGKKDNLVQFGNSSHVFVNSTNISEEYVKVICKYNSTEIYKDFFNFVPLKISKANITKPKLNVLIIGLDAVSRLNLYRQMPKTVEYLKDLKAFEMMGYNKVGDNTYPNLIPVLTGQTEDELKTDCWPTEESYFDNCSFIWKDYSKLGYATAFGEDSSWMGLFYYTKRGFMNKITDYFWDSFNMVSENEIGNNHRLNVNECVGGRQVYKVFLDYISKFTESMQEHVVPYFGFFWGSSLSHDFVNKPKLGDTDYYNLLASLNNSGKLKNTALIFLSDHGIRWGDIRSTYQGVMEERLPFLFLKLPDWFVNNNPNEIYNLKKNTRRLTTPFDLHETLKSLLNHTNLPENEIRRGYSLFDVIPTNRTCDDAGIASHWCTCQISSDIDVTLPIVIEAANFTVNEHINNLLSGYSDCAVLELDEILSSRLQDNGKDLLKSAYSQDYIITFKTKPGGAIFEATVRKYVHSDSYHFNVTGTVSRINLYGNQSLCITDFHLKLYCYCKQYFPRKLI